MHEAEEKALRWLIGQGIPRESIRYQARESPDFIVGDGRWFEAKRIVNRAIAFSPKQFEKLKRNAERTTILAFADD